MPSKKTRNKPSKKISNNELSWRKVPDKWTDTMFEITLLENPSRMTAEELARALCEYNLWRRGKEKYDYRGGPFNTIEEEREPPFSPKVLGRLIEEATVRLFMIGQLTLGRLKSEDGLYARR